MVQLVRGSVAGIGDEPSLRRECGLQGSDSADAQPDAQHGGEHEADQPRLRERSEQGEALRLGGRLVQDDLDRLGRSRRTVAVARVVVGGGLRLAITYLVGHSFGGAVG
jgi:hypothetical protein